MALSSVPLPFYGQLPYGYQPLGQVSSGSAGGANSSSSGTSASTSSGNPTDVVDIRSNRSGTFTAADSDLFSLSGLYTATAPTGSSIAGYKVALRSDQAPPNAGQLLLGDQDVTGQLSFTADEFSRLHFKAGPSAASRTSSSWRSSAPAWQAAPCPTSSTARPCRSPRTSPARAR